jgi:hypothetical protein
MADEPRRVYVGLVPSGADVIYVGEGAVDPVAIMLREANAKLDAERAAETRALAAKAADIERVRRTKKARVMRHLRKAMTLLGYGRMR